MKIIQPSFSAGELAPSLYARVDTARYAVAAAKMRNFFVDFRGGATTRAGTEYIGRTKLATYTRLIRFQFSVIQNYVLEFGHQYIRFLMNGGYVLETGQAITGVTAANPGVVTSTAHGFTTGQWVYIAGVGGMTRLNGQFFIVGATTANTFELLNLDGGNYNTTGFTAYTSGGTASRVYEISSPYIAADLPILKFTQSADVMTLTHPSYAPRDLTRTGHAAWTLSTVTFGADIAAPGGLSGSENYDQAASGHPNESTAYGYVVTAVDADGDESAPSAVETELGPVPGVVNNNNGDIIPWRVEFSWSAVSGAEYYNVYRAPIIYGQSTIPSGATFAFIGSTTGTTFYDSPNITSDPSTTPPKANVVFDSTDNYPGSVAYYQQRKVFARTNNKPMNVWMSQVGIFHNMNESKPAKASDAINITIASQQVNEIKHMIPMPNGLVLLTSGSAFQIASGGQGLSATTVDVDQQAYTGTADLIPVTVGFDILYVQSKGATIRNLTYDFFRSTYAGADISYGSSHFFYGHRIVSWDYAEEPFRIVWAAREDGILLSLTYVKDQEVAGWAQHDTRGRFVGVCTVPEGSEDATYFIVKRTMGNVTRQYVEKMASRVVNTLEEAWAVDCGLSTDLDFRNSTVSINGTTGTVMFLSNPGVFVSGDVGKHIRLGDGKAVITTYNSATNVVGTVIRPIVTNIGGGELPSYEPGSWSIGTPVSTVTGLEHLEGQTIDVLADGLSTSKTVTAGAIALDAPASLVRAGFGFVAQFQTLPLELGEPTVQGKMKRVAEVVTRLHKSRGLKVGSTFDTLKPMREPANPIVGQPIELYSTDNEQFFLDASWNTRGQICFQQDDPFPSTILGVIPEIRIALQKTSDEK